ncbi:MAG TPA: DNA helicase PcrA [Firmicutes bacterium]|nr:DNA helicase PcrA [Bacillota bacterium]
MGGRSVDILAGLNAEQRAAVTHGDGPLLILAGAGSGKTRVLTHRIAYLVRERGVDPAHILAVTFTNKAAQEMKRRVEGLLGFSAAGMWVMTFHSACGRILRCHGERIGLPANFVIFDTSDQVACIKEALREYELDPQNFVPRSVLERISRAKNELKTAETYAAEAGDFYERTVAKLFARYQEILRRNKALDFDDLLTETVRLFQEVPEALAHYQDRFRYLLVDEYQDTNHAQYTLVNLLAARDRNLAVVGDDNQSIYGWRGADIRNILAFERDYPECRVVKLERNYRSTQNILSAANQVIAYNLARTEKKLWTDRGDGEPLAVYLAQDDRDEARFVAEEIQRLTRSGYNCSDIALLYRTNAQSRTFEETFLHYGLPYAVVGTVRFYERKEIKDLLAYLRVVYNPDDSVSLRRVINVPKRGVGATSLAKLEDFALEQGLSLYQALQRAGEIPGLGAKTVGTLREFAALLAGLAEKAKRLPVAELATAVLKETGYEAELLAERSVEAEARLENLEEFVNTAAEFDSRTDEPSLGVFLEQVALLSDADTYNPGAGGVTLMTLHAAKGLEFPVVFLVGMEEGTFPHSRSTLEPGDLEEERRLCYVGITRAMDRLYLTAARQRFVRGQVDFRIPSRFLEEIPRELRRELGTRARPDTWAEDSAVSAVPTSPAAPAATGSGLSDDRRAVPSRAAAPAGLLDLRPGEKVAHPRWGSGTVVAVEGTGANATLTVAFPGEGVKKLLAGYAPLTRVAPAAGEAAGE